MVFFPLHPKPKRYLYGHTNAPHLGERRLLKEHSLAALAEDRGWCQHSCVSLQQPITSVTGDLMPSPHPPQPHHQGTRLKRSTQIYICRQNTHIHKIKIKGFKCCKFRASHLWGQRLHLHWFHRSCRFWLFAGIYCFGGLDWYFGVLRFL